MIRNKSLYLLVIILLLSVSTACNSTSEGPLPHATKGYEVYSWQEQDQWHFTLITGTDRTKTLEEIISGENMVSQDGWVRIQAVGVDEIKSVLSRLPKNEWVSWNGGRFVTPTEQAVVKLILPPEAIVSEIKEYAEKCGLDFMVFGQ